MPNPWLLLGVGVAWVVSVSIAYVKGKDAMSDQMRAEHATQLEAAIAQHNEDAATDMQAALEAGKLEAKVRTKVVTITNEVERAIASKPAPAVCFVQPDTIRLLNLAVAIANGDADAAGAVPNPGPKTPAADKP